MTMSKDLFDIFQELDAPNNSREEYIREPFTYPGCKSKSIKHIAPHLPYRNAYIEPCGGSGAMLLSRRTSRLEVFNDRYAGVTSFYRVLRSSRWGELLDRLEATVHSREEFIWCKSTWKNCQDDVERAARWMYMVQNSFAGLGRNFARNTNTPAEKGSALRGRLKSFEAVHKRLLNVQIENMDVMQLLYDYDHPDAVFYIDPTYIGVNRVYPHEMTFEEHRAMLDRVFEMKSFVAVSNYDNELYNSYHWDDVIRWDVFSSMTSAAKTESNNLVDAVMARGKAQEVLYIKEYNH